MMDCRLLKDGFIFLRTVLKKHETTYPDIIDKPPGSVVLVLAPHPDDDVIGCGATLYKHHIAGDAITVVYLTDGRKGDSTYLNEEDLVIERKHEAERAVKIIGVNNVVFLNQRDQQLKKNRKLIDQVIDLFDNIKPEVVYLPFFLDNHPDHIATNDIFVAACQKKEYEFDCYAYEIWTPLIPNRVIDISLYIQIKIDALNQHKTQLKHINYTEKIKGLNSYRSITVPNATYVEAFFYSKVKEYIKLFYSKQEK